MPIFFDRGPCDVDGCQSLEELGSGFCAVHQTAKQAVHVPTGTKCTTCNRVIERGHWITRESTMVAMTHAHCPDARPRAARRAAHSTPLLDVLEENR